MTENHAPQSDGALDLNTLGSITLLYLVLGAAIKTARRERARADAAEILAKQGVAFRREIEAGDGLTFRDFHQKYFPDVREQHFFAHLYRHGYIVDQRGSGAPSQQGYRQPGPRHRYPKAKGKPYLYLHHEGHKGENGKWEQSRVRRGRPELAFRLQLVREGLTAGEQPTLFGTLDSPLGVK